MTTDKAGAGLVTRDRSGDKRRPDHHVSQQGAGETERLK